VAEVEASYTGQFLEKALAVSGEPVSGKR
jgi:hypothetical protein